MRYFLLVLFFLFIYAKVYGQDVSIDNIHIESNSEVKSIEIVVSIDNAKLDSLKRIKLFGNATAFTLDGERYSSDSFYSDDYFDNFDNQYTIVFDSIPIDKTHFEKMSGVFRLFNPSVKNKSIVKIPQGKLAFNQNIIALDSSDIKVVLIDGIYLSRIRNKKRKLGIYIKSLIDSNQLNEFIFLETLNKYFENNKKTKILKNISDNLLFYIENTDFKVVSITIDDIQENKIRWLTSKINGSQSGIWSFKNFGDKLSNDFAIETVFENSKSINDFKFELYNLKLE